MTLTEQIEFFARTDTGQKRKHNEDNFLVDRDLRLFVVADGMGGHAAGEVASAIAVRTVHEVVAGRRDLLHERNLHGPRSEVSQREILSLLELAVQEASRRIHADAQSDSRKRGMGTTMSLLLLLEERAYVAHVGDSRIYLVRDGHSQQVTEDHTIANELIRLGIVSAEAVHNVPNKNAITRAVGVYEHVEVDTLTLDVLPADQFVIASDGLSGYLDDREVALTGYLDNSDGERIVESLIGFANDQGGKDNITVVLVRIGGGSPADTARAKRVALKQEILKHLPLFSRLNEREQLRVMQAAEIFEFEAGEHVVREGEAGDRMFVTLQGRLEVSTKGALLGELGPGEHFGEMSLIRSRPRSADVKAIEPSALITIKREDFFEIIRTEHRIAVKLLWQFLGVLAHRLERTSRELSLARGELDLSMDRRIWVDDEPSLDPFAGPGSFRASLPVRPVTLPGIDDDVELPPISFGAAPPIAQRQEGAPRPYLPSEGRLPGVDAGGFDETMARARARTVAGLGPKEPLPSDPAVTPRIEERPRLEAERDAVIAELAREAPGGHPRREKITRKIPAVPAPELDPDEKKTLPAARSRSETMKSAIGSTPEIQTRPDRGLRKARDEATATAPFQPTQRTIPLRPSEDFQQELDELRREFKARLAQARMARSGDPQRDSAPPDPRAPAARPPPPAPKEQGGSAPAPHEPSPHEPAPTKKR